MGFFKQITDEVARVFRPKTGQDKPALLRIGWFMLQPYLLSSRINPFSGPRVAVLRLFGADIGDGVTIRPGVKVKFPWKLKVGDNASIGEDAWLDNMEQVTLGDRVVVSQGAYLCTGNHDWDSEDRRLTALPITVEENTWIGASTRLGPGITIGRDSIISLGCTVVKDVEPGSLVFHRTVIKKRKA